MSGSPRNSSGEYYDAHPFNPRHEDGWCRWCGHKIPMYGSKPGAGVNTYVTRNFCTGACAARYADLCLEKGHRYVKRPDGKEA